MKILVLSDLHLEHMPDYGLTFLQQELPEHDVLVLAGDIASNKGITYALPAFAQLSKNVVYVLGNHEFYGSSIKKTRELIATVQVPNVHILDNSTCTIDGQRFVGSTMWYPLDRYKRLRKQSGDFRFIKDADPGVFEENATSVQFLQKEVCSDDVVVTHFLPSPRSIAAKYQGDPFNDYFLCDMHNLIIQEQPTMWIHGHTHESMDYRVARTRVYCNPYGYLDENDLNPNFTMSVLDI